ncbi:MAG: hypothetical protein JWN76_1764 [Chitinophagaceae bacterium]|nr:hypothetical protein [Chitinophagaceae bacterium]
MLLAALFFLGNTIPPKNKKPSPSGDGPHKEPSAVTTDQVITQSKQSLKPEQVSRLTALENAVVRGDIKNQQLSVYHQLARFWGDTMNNRVLGAYYLGESAKLENSEKNLTFAARLLLDELMQSDNPPMQQWLGTETKKLFEKSLELDPKNDSARIGIGACYMFGNISDNPMQGILAIRQIAEKNPHNLYAQMMLGMGGIRSGQYDKAIERFLIVVKEQPNNLEAIFHLAETYDRKGDKANAIKWYKSAEENIAVPEAKKEIQARIKTLQTN